MNDAQKLQYGGWLFSALIIWACGSNDSVPSRNASNPAAWSGARTTAGAGATQAPSSANPPPIVPVPTATPPVLGVAGSPGGNAGVMAPATPPAPMGMGAGGMFAPRAELDPNLRFDWPETLPGQNVCAAGTYKGMFNCTLMSDQANLFPIPIEGMGFTGPITLTFEKSSNGEFLTLADAKLEGIAADTIGFTAKLDGKLDCSTLELTARVVEGQYGLGLPILLPGGNLVGTLSGMLEPRSGEITGKWSVTDEGAEGLFSCVGPWQAVLQ